MSKRIILNYNNNFACLSIDKVSHINRMRSYPYGRNENNLWAVIIPNDAVFEGL